MKPAAPVTRIFWAESEKERRAWICGEGKDEPVAGSLRGKSRLFARREVSRNDATNATGGRQWKVGQGLWG